MNLLIFNLKTDADDGVLGFTTDWINALSRYFTKVFVITMVSGRISVAPNVKVFSVGKEKGLSEFKRLLNFYHILSDIIRSEGIDVCFAHMMPLFAVLGWPVLTVKRIPIVLWYAHGKVTATLRVAEKLVDKIITPSSLSFRIKSNKVIYSGHGIDCDSITFRNSGPSPGAMNILYVGRISRIKGIDLIIEALRLYKDNYGMNAELTIVGGPLGPEDASYGNMLKARVENLNLSSNVHWIGSKPHSQIWEYYQKADIFINPSNTGSIDKTVLEAMASGLLVITGNEAFDSDEFKNAGGVFAKNDPSTICNVLNKVAGMNSDDIQRRLISGRKWVEECHGMNNLIRKLSELMVDLKRGKPAG